MKSIIIALIVYFIAVIGYFYHQYSTTLDSYHKRTIELVQTSYESALNSFERSNDNFHAIYSDKLARLVSKVNNNSHNREKIRQETVQSMMKFYSAKKLDSLEGFHIFDYDGHSFVRLHQLNRYDDIIIKKRFSLQQMKEKFQYQRGYEVGVYKDAYRFQYPLFYDGEYVGSYEYSIGIHAIIKEMKRIFADQYILLFNQRSIESIVDPEVIKNRFELQIVHEKKYYYQAFAKHDRFNPDHLKQIMQNKNILDFLKAKQTVVLDYTYDGETNTAVFMGVYDFEGKKIATLIADVRESPKYGYLKNFIVDTLFVLFIGLIVALMLIKSKRYQVYVRNLLNIQHEMLVVTTGDRMLDANDTLLHFFGYNTIEAFLHDHSCICDFFIEEDGYIVEKMNGVPWIDYIKAHPSSEHKVKIYDKYHHNYKIFEVTTEEFESSSKTFVSFRDITKSEAQIEHLERRATYDPLTKIYNRERFEFYLLKALENAQEKNTRFSLIMFDIDHFKDVNDDYGHDVGDIILTEVVALVQTHIREVDIFARWGGEEFMIISNIHINSAEAFAQKLKELIEKHEFPHIDRLTCSFGLVEYRDGDDLESITKRCDKMLYSAKESGRNCVVSLR